MVKMSVFENGVWKKAARILKESGRQDMRQIGKQIEKILGSTVSQIKMINIRSEDMVAYQYYLLEHLNYEEKVVDEDEWHKFRRETGEFAGMCCEDGFFVAQRAQARIDEHKRNYSESEKP